jgi:hypothetical protein
LVPSLAVSLVSSTPSKESALVVKRRHETGRQWTCSNFIVATSHGRQSLFFYYLLHLKHLFDAVFIRVHN